MNTDNPTVQHTINGVAALAAPISIWTHAPEVVTFIAGILGIVWYSVLIGEKLAHWKKYKKWPLKPSDD